MDDIGHKRSLTAVLKLLEEEGHDVDLLMNRICDLIIKTIVTVQPQLAHVYRSSQPDDFENSMVFEILGFDVLLDYKLRPFLLEVNHSPSFTTDTPLDQKIKRGLIKDTVTLLNLNPQRKEEYKKRKAEELQ